MTTSVRARLEALGLTTTAPLRAPPGVTYPFEPVRVAGNLVWVSGHLPLESDGTVAEPRGKVGGDVGVADATLAARRVALAMLGSLERELGSLERIARWLRVFAMVNQVDGFVQQPRVVDGFSNLVLEVFGPEVGAHARSAIGVAGLPFDTPVEIEAVLEIERRR